jgi:hypothetical protein
VWEDNLKTVHIKDNEKLERKNVELDGPLLIFLKRNMDASAQQQRFG